MNIVLLESLSVSDETLNACAKPLVEAGHTFAAYPKDTDPSVMIERAKDADIVMLANMPLPGEVIAACDRLKFIDVAFTGVDHVDLEAARAKGIAGSNAAGYSTQAVAELCVCMALSLLRNLPQVSQRCRTGGTKDGLVGSELGGKTVGIVGTGAIGLRTAQLFAAFGCKILAYAPRPKENAKGIVEYVSLETLLRESDIVSLHCPLNDSSRGLIDAQKLGLMKSSALLLNAARGPVVDSQALAEALDSGAIAGAGIDVFEVEPPLPADHPLLHCKNILVTPHVAFASRESMEARCKIVFENIEKWLAGEQVNTIL